MDKILPPPLWPEQGQCFQQADPELFFPAGEKGQLNLLQIERAKAFCRRCDMAERCLAWALAHEDHGIWGGLSADERRELKRRRGRRHKIA